MNTQSDFTAGQMVAFKATRDFSMGGMSIQKGMTIGYDGYNVSISGRQQPFPSFKGVLRVGWAVPVADFDVNAETPPPRSAGIKVRPADTGNPMKGQATSMTTVVDHEERIVGDVQSHAQGVRNSNQARRNITAAAEPQDGVVVRTLSPSNSKDGARTTLTGTNVQQLINQASSVQITPGQGRTRDEVIAQMTDEQRDRYLAEIEARKSAYITPSNLRNGDADGPRVVGRVEQPGVVESGGFTTTTVVGGGIDTVDLSGLDSEPAALEVSEVEGMKFTRTASPKRNAPEARPGLDSLDPRRVIARAICSDFPDLYDFEATPKKKIARLQADFEDRPDVIRAVAAAETDSTMRGLLLQEFPVAFGS